MEIAIWGQAASCRGCGRMHCALPASVLLQFNASSQPVAEFGTRCASQDRVMSTDRCTTSLYACTELPPHAACYAVWQCVCAVCLSYAECLCLAVC